VQTLREAGCAQLVLLKCTGAYPSLPENMNLRTIPDLARSFVAPVGLSDHTLGTVVPVAALALSACIIEKHLTLKRSDGGPDSAFSLEPVEFRQMVDTVRIAEKALGRINYAPTNEELQSRVFRRSLFVFKDVNAGERFTTENVRSIRPAHGLSPNALPRELKSCASMDLLRGTALSEKHLKGAC
jgi:pseudaminic acid synthase